MRAHGAITTEPDVMPTAAQIKKLRHDLESHPMDCIFDEPFLGQKALGLIAEGSDIRIRQLDPLGSQLALISDDHIGGLFGNHDRWGVGIA